jgi:hypothetical protein
MSNFLALDSNSIKLKNTYFYEEKIEQNIVNENGKTKIKQKHYINDNGKENTKCFEKILNDKNKDTKKYKIKKF